MWLTRARAWGREYYPKTQIRYQASPSYYPAGLAPEASAICDQPKIYTVFLAARKSRTKKPREYQGIVIYIFMYGPLIKIII